MAEVSDVRGLLVNALQDLHDAERAWGERVPLIASHARSEPLLTLIEGSVAHSDERMGALATMIERLGDAVDGAPNIWMRAVLDDAARDTATVAPGDLLDIALVGALRKGMQSARVSFETAMMLADQIGRDQQAASIRAMRDQTAETDGQLRELLGQLTI